MKHISTLILLCVLLLTSCEGCEKRKIRTAIQESIDNNTLPPATQVGANTMGCLVDGEVWLPLTENFFDELVFDVKAQYDGSFETLHLQFTKAHDGMYSNLNMSTSDFNGLGSHGCAASYDNDTIGNYVTLLDGTNILQVTRFDSEGVAGTFNVNVKNDQFSDTVRITQGRFGIAFN